MLQCFIVIPEPDVPESEGIRRLKSWGERHRRLFVAHRVMVILAIWALAVALSNGFSSNGFRWFLAASLWTAWSLFSWWWWEERKRIGRGEPSPSAE